MTNHVDDRLRVLFNVVGIGEECESTLNIPIQEKTKPTDTLPNIKTMDTKPEREEKYDQVEEVNVQETVNKFIKFNKHNIPKTSNQPNQSQSIKQTVSIEQPTVIPKSNRIEEPFNHPNTNKITDKEKLVRNIIQYGITIDGVKEKSGKLFDFSFDYRDEQISVEDLEMELIEDEEDSGKSRKPNFLNRFLKRK